MYADIYFTKFVFVINQIKHNTNKVPSLINFNLSWLAAWMFAAASSLSPPQSC